MHPTLDSRYSAASSVSWYWVAAPGRGLGDAAGRRGYADEADEANGTDDRAGGGSVCVVTPIRGASNRPTMDGTVRRRSLWSDGVRDRTRGVRLLGDSDLQSCRVRIGPMPRGTRRGVVQRWTMLRRMPCSGRWVGRWDAEAMERKGRAPPGAFPGGPRSHPSHQVLQRLGTAPRHHRRSVQRRTSGNCRQIRDAARDIATVVQLPTKQWSGQISAEDLLASVLVREESSPRARRAPPHLADREGPRQTAHDVRRSLVWVRASGRGRMARGV